MIEVPLKAWARDWSLKHAGEPAARAELERMAQAPLRTLAPTAATPVLPGLAEAALDRAESTARALLKAPAPR